jgi:hypothetical protein
VFRELSVTEQRYQAVLSVIEDGLQVSEAAAKAGVTRQALHSWLSRYAGGGLEALADRSHRPRSCQRQMNPASVQVTGRSGAFALALGRWGDEPTGTVARAAGQRWPPPLQPSGT